MGFRDSGPVRKMHNCYSRRQYAKTSNNIPFPFKRCKRLHWVDENKPLQKAFWCIYHDLYLFKLYGISIILLLTNSLANICSEISEIWLNLWMVYTWILKSPRMLKRSCHSSFKFTWCLLLLVLRVKFEVRSRG